MGANLNSGEIGAGNCQDLCSQRSYPRSAGQDPTGVWKEQICETIACGRYVDRQEQYGIPGDNELLEANSTPHEVSRLGWVIGAVPYELDYWYSWWRCRYFRIEEDPKAKVSSNFMTNFLEVWKPGVPAMLICVDNLNRVETRYVTSPYIFLSSFCHFLSSSRYLTNRRGNLS